MIRRNSGQVSLSAGRHPAALLAALLLFGQAHPCHVSGNSPEGSPTGPPKLFLDRSSGKIFPKSWLAPRVNASAGLLDLGEQDRADRIVRRAFRKYPPSLLHQNLKNVYVLSRLEFSGVSTGGTNSRDSVYLVCRHYYLTNDVERIFHAEFSSILLRNFPDHLNREAWRKVNPPAFRYGTSGVQAIKNQADSLRFRSHFHEEGFLNEYARASVEEDFNSFASRLFLGSDDLWQAAERYPGVRTKTQLVLAFFESLHPSLTENYFRELRTRPPS